MLLCNLIFSECSDGTRLEVKASPKITSKETIFTGCGFVETPGISIISPIYQFQFKRLEFAFKVCVP
ncbi:unnamed protein product [Lymnaea stagnalis]|uniref:Uncharacterized protein n=1 Tax=Lymnaea stagnalis TaxID=6523 RepID=A0AAV2HUU7_LYMST